MATLAQDPVVIMTAGKPVDLPPPVKTASSAYGGDSGFSPTAGAPFSSAFAQRSVEETDRFVLEALGKSTDDPSPRLGGTADGELDALAFAMGALQELADEDDVNQVRAAMAALRRAGAAARGRAATRGAQKRALTPLGADAPSRANLRRPPFVRLEASRRWCTCCAPATRTTATRPPVRASRRRGPRLRRERLGRRRNAAQPP